MSGRFVRASKYRHVFGRSTKKEQCYDNLRISNNAWDTNLVKANPSYISVNWEASGGGAFAVIPLDERGKLPERIPLCRGHTAVVLDTDWNPFNDQVIASGSDDGKVFLWKIPDDFTLRPDVKPDEVEDISPYAKLSGHTRKVGHVLFNPAAENILASSAGDYTIKLWDIGPEQPKLTLKHPDIVQSLSWSANGSMLVTTCRDKKLRIWDTRQEKAVVETPGHGGAKNSRAVWMGDHDRIATTGFSKMSDRQLGLWDIKAPRAPLNGFEILDSISGVCMPFWDDGNQILYLAGKGDGNIRYFEYQNDKLEFLSQHTSTDPQRGIAFLPKRGVDTHDNEVARAFKTVDDRLIEPISFIVPRRAEVFQDDIYPPCVGTKPAMSASEWLAGADALPPKISLESVYEGQAPVEVPAEAKPKPVASTPAPAKTPVKPTPAPEPTPIPVRAPPPSMKDNQTSLSNVADRFAAKKGPADDDEEDEEDDASSFEEVPRPADRRAARAVEPASPQKPTATTSAPAPKPAPAPTATTTVPAVTPVPTTPATNTTATLGHRPSLSNGSGAAGAAEGLRAHLADIKALLETQGRTIAAQSEKIDALASQVEKLRGPDARDEKIRMLELELEAARGG